MKNKIIQTEKIVEKILEKYPRTRKSDHLLYRAYHYDLFMKGQVHVNFETFFTYPEKYNASSFATVERCRRRLQHFRPELSDNVAKINREYLQEVFHDYSI